LCFSALQRAENSSNPQSPSAPAAQRRFSALQRAENSSNDGDERGRVTLPPFQCSSASRKFLKGTLVMPLILVPVEFQCSSASRKFLK